MADGRIVFKGANLFDGENTPRSGVSVVVEGQRISAVSQSAPAPAAGDVEIDCTGKTLMPGMVQGHFHAGFGAFGGAIAAPVLGLEAPPTYMGALGAKNMNTALNCGFTMTIGSSNGDGLDVSLREAILHGLVDGPRVVACTREFVTSGDEADGTNRSWFMGLGHTGLIRRCDGPESFRQAAREELGRGCDVVKLSVAMGHGSTSIPDVCLLTDAELRAVCETAHERGKRVRAHCPSRKAIIACAKAGVDIIDHADKIDAEGIEAVLKADATVVPSMLWSVRFLGFAENWDHAAAPFPISDGFPESLDDTLARIRAVRADYEYTAGMLPELAKSGVRLIVGDDFGTPLMPHGDYVSELELYVKDLGIPALDVLRWATKNGAEAAGLGDELGTIAPGKLADLLVIDGDPLADMAILDRRESIQLVMKGGTVQLNRLSHAAAPAAVNA
jgi:imidazolonepropionase-like amidohydrolase